MVTTFCSIQFVTEVDNQTIILYTNRLLGAADNVRPWHINVVPESPGESRLIEIIRLNILKKKLKCLKIIQKFFNYFDMIACKKFKESTFGRAHLKKVKVNFKFGIIFFSF